MMVPITGAAPFLEFAVAGRARRGESVSGDQFAVSEHARGVVVAVADGLGHGVEAAAVARRAVEAVAGCPSPLVTTMVRSCHEALVGSRGVALALARLDAGDGRMTWLGVGNVAGALVRADAPAGARLERMIPRRGVVGLRLPPLRAAVHSVEPGDLLIFATDGIRPEFTTRLGKGVEPHGVADDILERYAVGSDDALVLVARRAGGSGPP